MKKGLWSAGELKDVIKYLENQTHSSFEKKAAEKPSRLTNSQLTYEGLTPETRDLTPYLQVLEGVAK